MIEERVFDFVAVRSGESREVGEASDGIVGIAGFEKGEHCFFRSRNTCCAWSLSNGV